MNMSEEEILTHVNNMEEYEQYKALLASLVADTGELLGYYEIEVEDNNTHEVKTQGPFTIKIKITEAMKEFNIFYLVYLNNQFETEDKIALSVEGDYLVGTLPHLSGYILAGSNTSNHIHTDIILLMILLLTFISTTFILKNRLSN